MKTLLKIAIVFLVLVVNLSVAQPSLADRVKVTKNPDYVELTQAIENLRAEQEAQGDSPALQQQIDELQLQKAAIEAGVTWGQCRNETGKTLAIYGPKGEDSKSPFDNDLYFLGDGEVTPEGWDCNGIYLPSGINTEGISGDESLAYRILDGTQLVVSAESGTGELLTNVAPASLFKAGDANWPVPKLSQTFIESRIPSALVAGEIDD